MTLSFSYNSEEPAPWSESEYITSIMLTCLLVLPIKKIIFFWISHLSKATHEPRWKKSRRVLIKMLLDFQIFRISPYAGRAFSRAETADVIWESYRRTVTQEAKATSGKSARKTRILQVPRGRDTWTAPQRTSVQCLPGLPLFSRSPSPFPLAQVYSANA